MIFSPQRPRRGREARQILEDLEEAVRREQQAIPDLVAAIGRARGAGIAWRQIGRAAQRVTRRPAFHEGQRLRKVLNRHGAATRDGSR